jgi:replicative DNA helicase
MPNDPQIEALKTPPHSIEGEQSVLGGLLIDNTAIDRIADVVSEADFYNDGHRLIFRAINDLVMNNKPADVITVGERLESLARLEYVGGLSYLGALVQGVPTAANIRRYAEIVRERSILRQLAMVGGQIAENAFNPLGRSASQLLDEAEGKVFEIAEQGARTQQGFLDIKPLLTKVVERIEELYHRDNPSDVTGVPSGFTDLDGMTSGLQPGDLVIIAGRPSMGKAQPLDAKVKTPEGWKAIGELRLGDRLASVDGGPSRVSGIFPQGVKQIYRVTFSDGRSSECCGEHLWRVHCRDWDAPRIMSTDEVAAKLKYKRYAHRLWIDTPSGDFGHEEELPLNPWVLGALLGEGSLSGGSLTFSAATEAMLDELAGPPYAPRAAGGYDWGGVETGGASGISPNPMINTLRSLGLWHIRSEDKFIPQIYLDASKAARVELLLGLIDTDGWVESWGSVRFCASSPQLAEQVAQLVRSLGGWCAVSKQTTYSDTAERRSGKRNFVCNIRFPEPKSLLRLSGARGTALEELSRQWKPVFASIEPSRTAQACCISVTHPDRLYITDDYVVTHNTSFALNIGENIALEAGLPIGVFSMEMGATQLALRMIGSVGRLDQHRIRTGRLHGEDWEKLSTALGKLNDAPVHIDETPALNPYELRARARRLARQYGGKLGALIVDYIQLMQSASPGENRATEISEISRSLKALAKELNCPVLALSQLNRSLEQRPNKRPVMSDLRESGAIEQDADVIFFIYRDEVYNPDTPEKGVAEIIIGKQRNGPIGTVKLTFLGQYTRFENYASAGRY